MGNCCCSRRHLEVPLWEPVDRGHFMPQSADSFHVNIMKIDTTGAYRTAEKCNLQPGVAASVEMAKRDLERLRRYSSVIKHVAKERGIDPAVIAAIISRDQIQVNDDSEEQLHKVINHLADCIRTVRSDFPTWTKEMHFKGGIAARKAKRIRSYQNVDEYTDGEDYSNDVIARAKWFKKNKHF